MSAHWEHGVCKQVANRTTEEFGEREDEASVARSRAREARSRRERVPRYHLFTCMRIREHRRLNRHVYRHGCALRKVRLT